MTVEKIRVSQDELTFRELADVEEQLGASLSVAFEQSQAKAMAALVWVTKRRTDPTFTFDQAFDLPSSVLETTLEEPDPEARGGDIGVSPPPSPESGLSILTG